MNLNRKKCADCNNPLNDKSIIRLNKAPNSAQNFLNKKLKNKNKSVDLIIKQCSGCDLVQTVNKPVKYHKKVIRAVGFSPSMMTYRINQFKNFKDEFKLGGKKIIEIGCGTGDYLSILSRVFNNAYGLEYSKKKITTSNKKKLKIINNYLDKNKKINKKYNFDAFFIFSYLEHVPNINTFLNGIKFNLNENAVGIIEVPNFDMILKKRLYSEFIIDHLYYFTKKTLIRTLELNGFEVINVKSIWDDYILSATVFKRSPLKLNNTKNYFKENEKIIKKFINTDNKKNIAVWGAGHQSLTLISQTNIVKRIRYIVDSAIFKQNKIAPGLNVNIVSPKIFFDNNLRKVIVIAGGYTNEICRLIRLKNKKIKILYLKNHKFAQ